MQFRCKKCGGIGDVDKIHLKGFYEEWQTEVGDAEIGRTGIITVPLVLEHVKCGGVSHLYIKCKKVAISTSHIRD